MPPATVLAVRLTRLDAVPSLVGRRRVRVEVREVPHTGEAPLAAVQKLGAPRPLQYIDGTEGAMTKTVRGVLEGPTVLRLDEPVDLPLHVPVDVTITEPGQSGAEASTFLALADVLQLDGPADFSERWEEYVAAEDAEQAR